MIYKEQLENILREICERKEDLISELSNLPEGRLMIIEQDGVTKYLQRIPKSGNRKKERRYGIKRKTDILNGLLRKEYIIKALDIIDENTSVLKETIERLKPSDENSVMKTLIEKHPDYVSGIYGARFDEELWKKSFSRIEGYRPENLLQTAADGTKMRSKNEVYIASRLDHYGLTYRSDCPTGIRGLNRVPDFTVLRKRDGKVIYWEHLGMMDDLEYRIDNKRKLEEYEKVGIVPWDNLILTYDTDNGGLRADMIEAMIRTWLL